MTNCQNLPTADQTKMPLTGVSGFDAAFWELGHSAVQKVDRYERVRLTTLASSPTRPTVSGLVPRLHRALPGLVSVILGQGTVLSSDGSTVSRLSSAIGAQPLRLDLAAPVPFAHPWGWSMRTNAAP